MNRNAALAIAVFLLSAGALAYELLLVRLLSIIQWQHFAAMIISLALLGYGASGTFLAFARRKLEERFALWFAVLAALFLVTAGIAYVVGQSLPLNPLELPWDWRQLAILGTTYLIFSVPFFFAAAAIGLAFARAGGKIAGLYRADLAGAGVGAIGMIFVLSVVVPPRLRVSPYKPLSQVLRVPGARVAAQRPAPLGLIHAVESPLVPLRFAPGLSLNYTDDLPDQVGVFIDAAALTVINPHDPEKLGYLDFMTSALPYHVRRLDKVLVMNSGAGADVQAALRQGSKQIDALEVHQRVIELLTRDYADFSGHLYEQPRVKVHTRHVRAFLASTNQRFDLVVDSSSAAGGVAALGENYVYTVEGFRAMLRALENDGLIATTRAVNIPPRDTLKLVSTAIVALETMGMQPAAQHLVLVRGWNAVTVLVSRRPFSGLDLTRIRSFCEERSFDTGFYPGMRREEADRYNILDEPHFFDGVAALTASQRDEFLAQYKFDLTPATDNRPYVTHSLKWRTVPELLRLRRRGGAPLLETGYLTLVATAVQALIAATVLILLPLVVLRRYSGNWRMFLTFAAIGLAFLFVEIFFIQKLTLLLGRPLLAIAATLATFLIFAGVGSGLSRHVRSLLIPTAGIAVLLVIAAFVLPRLLGAGEVWQLAGSLTLIVPLAILMGMPFPMTMALAGAKSADWVVWGWAVNGCCSVLSPILATLMAIHMGFLAVAFTAALLYLAAGWLNR